VLAASSAVSFHLVARFSNEAYDTALLDSAYALRTQLRVVDGQPVVALSGQALELFQWDASDRVLFSIATADGRLLAGLGELVTASPQPAASGPLVFDARFGDEAIRGVTIRETVEGAGAAVLITVAETVNKRRTLRAEVLALVLVPQLLLLLLALYLLRSGIDRGLAFLEALVSDVAKRDPTDSRPIDAGSAVEEVRPLIDRFNDLLVRIGEVIDAQRRFIADASHQLRTPLATLVLQIHNLRARPWPDDAARELERIETSAQRAARLSRQFLALARAEPQLARREEFRRFDLVAAVRSIGEDLLELATGLGVELQIDTPAAPVPVLGHEVLIREMAANLIDNAMRHACSGRLVRIAVAAEPAPALSVEDRGPGIAQDELPKIFERFFRSNGAVHEGSGLGLAIVRQIATLHGARISVDTRPQFPGTRFTVVFAADPATTALSGL
jgi:two-component system sensor histidine kinase TctE